MKKIAVVFGTRPEAIKMGPLIHQLRKYPDEFEVEVWVTAQHREMLDQALEVFEIEPDLDMNLMKSGQDLFDITAAVLGQMKLQIKSNQPDIILVHGDTTTAMASTMAGFYAGIPVGHIEAGLRTHDIHSPFPEEFNRQLIGKIATWHYSPTLNSKQNLLDEGIASETIIETGNTIIDSLFWVLEKIQNNEELKLRIELELDRKLNFPWRTERFILITGHRRENFGKGFERILLALKQLSEERPDIHFVFPVHLNPLVKEPVENTLSNLLNVHLIEPLEYQTFSYLMKHCYLVMTDSGGIQEEAPSLGKPVLVLRDVTERPEAVIAGTAELVGTSTTKILESVRRLVDNPVEYEKMSKAHNPFGNGTACLTIVNSLIQH